MRFIWIYMVGHVSKAIVIHTCVYIYIYTPGPFTVEVRMEKPVGLHGSRLRPIPGEKVKLGYRASKCRKTDRESLTWK